MADRSPIYETFRQAYVVMKNEIKKYFSGKRMLLFLVLLVIILAILTSAPFLVGKDFSEGQMLTMYLTMSPLVVLMGATLFASITIVSEYEERTALIVFTRPISKASIFLGKLAASLIVTIAFTALYYLYAIVMMALHFGSIDSGMAASFGLSVAYAVGCIGIAMLISTVMKKSNTATILTFVAIMIVISAASMVLSIAGFDVSWMIDQASGSIATCSPGYREYTDMQIQGIAAALLNVENFVSIPDFVTALNGLVTATPTITSEIILEAFSSPGVWNFAALGEALGEMSVQVPDVAKDALVMVAWGAVSLVAAFILFLRREF
ncbi:MAG: ABC transporter permease [Thermoplasmata archaeon]|nr:ABC transporter permease [Thermoplasmata archaeon]